VVVRSDECLTLLRVVQVLLGEPGDFGGFTQLRKATNLKVAALHV